jgi:quercetin dioxygenase-like cupin family protein
MRKAMLSPIGPEAKMARSGDASSTPSIYGRSATGKRRHEEDTMATLQRKSVDQPDETRPVDKGVVEVVEIGGTTMMRTTFQPGWRWSECVKPIVGGDSCQVNHVGYCVSGTLHVQMEDGEELDISAGDASHIPPGHDAWVVGDEPYVALDFVGAEGYAKAS